MGISYSPSIVTDGLVLYLDAANPKSYPGSGNTWYDLSGNGNHGTLINGVEYNSENKGSMVFDGLNGYVNIAGYQFAQSSSVNVYTIVCFAKLSTVSSSRRQIWGSDNGGFDWGFGSGDSSRFTIFTGSGVSTGRPQDLLWHMITAQWTPAGASLYIDLSKEVNNSSIGYDSSINLQTNIGRNPGFGEYWNGNISFLCLWEKELNFKEITKLFNAFRSRYTI